MCCRKFTRGKDRVIKRNRAEGLDCCADKRTKEEWLARRKPELKALFQHYMYGKLPPSHKVEGKVILEDKKAFGGKATLQEIAVTLNKDWPAIHVLFVFPNERSKPVPVFVGMNFSGNHTLVKDPGVRLPTTWMYPGKFTTKDGKATEEGRGTAIDVWAGAVDRSRLRGGDVLQRRRRCRKRVRTDGEITSLFLAACGLADRPLTPAKPQAATRYFAVGFKLLDSTLGYYIREGKHSMTKEDWKVFLDFADKHLR